MNVTDEYQYLSHCSNILRMGDLKIENRNGETKEIIGVNMRFNLRNSTLPLLTTKLVSFKTVLKELLFFIRGDTDNHILETQGVKIWKDNSTREFLDGRGLVEYPEGQLGPIYGFQWRNFNGEYNAFSDAKTTDIENRIDQLQDVIDQLKDPIKRFSRRLIVSAWNPCQINMMALPPCHVMFQFIVNSGNELNCIMTQRSADMGLGVPYNIASYAILTHLIAHHCGLKPGELIINLGSAHVYKQHYDPLCEQVHRTPTPSPKLFISCHRENIEDYKVEDFIVEGYNHQGSIKMEMIA